jgi:hypothetical protein
VSLRRGTPFHGFAVAGLVTAVLAAPSARATDAAAKPTADPPPSSAAAGASAPTPSSAAASTVVVSAADSAKKKAAVAALVHAMTRGKEYQALEIVRGGGVDPNGRDDTGIPILNWAILACQPSVVKALVDLKADLTYQRTVGLTVLKEAGACPAAEKILRAAGAR